VAPTPAEPPAAEPVAAATPAPAAEAPAAPPPAAEATPEPEAKPVEPAPVEPPPAAPAVAEKPVAAEPPPVVARPEPVAQPVAETKKPEPAPEGLAAILKEPTTLLGASAAIIALLGAWLLPIGGRRRKAEAAAAPAPVAPAAPAPKAVEPPPAAVAEKAERMEPAATAAAVAAAAGTTAAVAAALPPREPERVSTEDLAALELSTTDLFGLKGETTEVDPTEEADVYIAYGRYEQAEQLLRLALEMEPGRLALKHKLLEVYFAARDASAYNALFSELQAAGREAEDPAAWQRALRMGRQIDPDNPVYAGTAQDERDLEAALREAEEGLAADLKAGSADLDTLKIDTRFSENVTDVDSGSVLNDLSLDLGAEEAGDKASHPFKLDVAEELEQLQKGGAGLAGELDEDDLAKAGGLPGGFGMEDLTPEQLEQDEDRAPDLSGIELTLEGGVPEQDTTLMHADTTLELVDDVETKLDLARAYIELGDNEGARGMLEEVLQEGNDAQKANAQAMLKELG
jgi:pilus assembly protein FimV